MVLNKNAINLCPLIKFFPKISNIIIEECVFFTQKLIDFEKFIIYVSFCKNQKKKFVLIKSY